LSFARRPSKTAKVKRTRMTQSNAALAVQTA
jgi:hypothetical protein